MGVPLPGGGELSGTGTGSGLIDYDAAIFHPGTTDPFPDWGLGGLDFTEDGDGGENQKAATGLRIPNNWRSFDLYVAGLPAGSGNVVFQADINNATPDPVTVACTAFTPIWERIVTDFTPAYTFEPGAMLTFGDSGYRFGNFALYRTTNPAPSGNMAASFYFTWLTLIRKS